MKCSAALTTTACALMVAATTTSMTSIGSVFAFAPSPVAGGGRSCPNPTSVSSSSLSSLSGSSSRRDVLDAAAAAGMASIFLVAAAVVVVPPASAEEPRPMYLTEPTEDFKANEAKSMEFKRQQLAIKKEFNEVLTAFLAEGNDEDKLVNELKAMKKVIARTGGLPLGIKKEDLFKTIRTKKAKGYWPTPVEIAYQSLIQEIRFQQSPNLDKETGNPFQ